MLVLFPGSTPTLPPLPEFSQQALLDLFDRLLPGHYLDPLKSPGPGYEFLQAVAAMNARVSEAVQHIGTGNYILSATGGAKATATVEFYRATFIFGAFTINAGTVVGTALGYRYVTTAPVVFGATDYGPHSVTVEAVVAGWEWNQPGPVTSAAGEVLAGPIDQLVTPLTTPDFADPTLQVRQVTAATGGVSPMLDGLGLDRGITRLPGESDAAYRARIYYLADTVSPGAIQRAGDRVLLPVLLPAGLAYFWLETCLWEYQTAYDCPPNVVAVPTPPPSLNIFVYVDSTTPVPFPPTDPYNPINGLSNRYMDEFDVSAALVFWLPYLDTDAETARVYSGFAAVLDQIRPAGVGVEFVLQGE